MPEVNSDQKLSDDGMIVCECGHKEFWYFVYFVRCTHCFNEYKYRPNAKEYWMRRFNKEKEVYSKNWEHFALI